MGGRLRRSEGFAADAPFLGQAPKPLGDGRRVQAGAVVGQFPQQGVQFLCLAAQIRGVADLMVVERAFEEVIDKVVHRRAVR